MSRAGLTAIASHWSICVEGTQSSDVCCDAIELKVRLRQLRSLALERGSVGESGIFSPRRSTRSLRPSRPTTRSVRVSPVRIGRALLLLAVVLLAACANQYSIHHKFDPNKGQSISIDAKQRVIYSINKTYGEDKAWHAICAEPSPDALTALSAGTSLDVSTVGKALGLAYAGQEGAASIGLRTQTITILRDAMYRLCEGYASGALDDIAYARLQRRYQAIVTGLLAIEQLTGAVVANQVSIGGNASAKLGQSFAQVSVMVQETRAKKIAADAATVAAKSKVDTAQKAEKVAKKTYDDAVAVAGGKEDADPVIEARAGLDNAIKDSADAQTEYEKSVQKQAIETGELASLETLRKEIDRASVLASTSAAFSAPPRSGSGPTDADSIKHVSHAVTHIVDTLVNRDYTRETCLDTLMSRSARVLASGGNTDALELAMRYCAFALEADALSKDASVEEKARRTAALTASRDAFTKAIDAVIAARRAAAKDAADKAAAEKAKTEKPVVKP
jgi:hypothetical protein